MEYSLRYRREATDDNQTFWTSLCFRELRAWWNLQSSILFVVKDKSSPSSTFSMAFSPVFLLLPRVVYWPCSSLISSNQLLRVWAEGENGGSGSVRRHLGRICVCFRPRRTPSAAAARRRPGWLWFHSRRQLVIPLIDPLLDDYCASHDQLRRSTRPLGDLLRQAVRVTVTPNSKRMAEGANS